jgi:hypothetical protein
MSNFLLKEDGDKLLKEDGNKILVSTAVEVVAPKPVVVLQAVKRASTH